MNGNIIQDKIYRGYAIAAAKIGKAYSLYRPSSATSVIDPGNLVQENFMTSLYQDKEYSQPNKYGNAVWKGLLDGRIAQVFDYITDGRSTYFINAMPQILPITLIECNTTIKVTRAGADVDSVGKQSYGADIRADEEMLMEGWPAAQIIGPKWERNPTGLPGDERSPWFVFYFPYFPGVPELRTADIVTDEHGRRHIISNPERTDFGYRVSAGFAGA